MQEGSAKVLGICKVEGERPQEETGAGSRMDGRMGTGIRS